MLDTIIKILSILVITGCVVFFLMSISLAIVRTVKKIPNKKFNLVNLIALPLCIGLVYLNRHNFGIVEMFIKVCVNIIYLIALAYAYYKLIVRYKHDLKEKRCYRMLETLKRDIKDKNVAKLEETASKLIDRLKEGGLTSELELDVDKFVSDLEKIQ